MKKIIALILGGAIITGAYSDNKELETQVETQSTQIEQVTNNNEELQKQIEQLIQDNELYTGIIESKESEIERLKDNMNETNEKNKQLKEEKQALIDEANEKIRILNEQIRQLENDNILLKAEVRDATEQANDNSATVYWNGGSSSSDKYHKHSTCSGMKGAVKMTENQAKSRGYVACKKCF